MVNFVANTINMWAIMFSSLTWANSWGDRVGKTFLPVKQCTQFEEMHAQGCGDIPYVCVFVCCPKEKKENI
jgi:hypothetical protein